MGKAEVARSLQVSAGGPRAKGEMRTGWRREETCAWCCFCS